VSFSTVRFLAVGPSCVLLERATGRGSSSSGTQPLFCIARSGSNDEIASVRQEQNMRYRGSNGRLEGSKNHSTRFVLLLLVIALLSFVPRAARTPQQTRKRPISAPEILAEASRLALLHN
jgi:hypothetical protein